MTTLRAVRASLVNISRRTSRVAHEAEDLAHDILLAALGRGLPLDGDTFLRSVHGAARRHGAFLARSAARRRAREASSAADYMCRSDCEEDRDDAPEGAPLSALSPALQTTLLLLLSGLEKAELRLALGVTDAALRKRFQALRDHAPLARPRLHLPERTGVLALLRRVQVALLPRLGRSGTASHMQAPRVLAVSDPDGHGIIFAEVLTPGGRAATTGAASNAPRAGTEPHAKGNPC